MYAILSTGELKGVLNDYDLASWDKHLTTNHDRTGTIPFMALEVLDYGLEERIPRLYRHDAESLIWVLTYATVINVEYTDHSANVSRHKTLDPWFRANRDHHCSSKRLQPYDYGFKTPVTMPHKNYTTAIRNLITHWVERYNHALNLRSTGLVVPEVDDPKGTLERMIEGMGPGGLGVEAQKVFGKVKTLLLEAIESPKVV